MINSKMNIKANKKRMIKEKIELLLVVKNVLGKINVILIKISMIIYYKLINFIL